METLLARSWPSAPCQPRGGDFFSRAKPGHRVGGGWPRSAGQVSVSTSGQSLDRRGNGVHGWVVGSQRGTGRSTPPAHLTRLCSFGHGHVCLPCHNWLSESRVERAVACSRHATLPRENQIPQSCHKQAHTCLANKYKWMCSPLGNEKENTWFRFEHSGVSECAR